MYLFLFLFFHFNFAIKSLGFDFCDIQYNGDIFSIILARLRKGSACTNTWSCTIFTGASYRVTITYNSPTTTMSTSTGLNCVYFKLYNCDICHSCYENKGNKKKQKKNTKNKTTKVRYRKQHKQPHGMI